jgi:hypothetical protein
MSVVVLTRFAVLAVPLSASAQSRPPIIDMHMHAVWWGPGTVEPLTGLRAPASSDELRRLTLAAMNRYNIVRAVVSGELVDEYRAAVPDRIIPGIALLGPSVSIDSLRALHRAGSLDALAEFAPQYAGLAPADPALEPYFALAEELDIPVGLHMGPGPPGAAYRGSPNYRMALSNPLLLEEVLVRHPRLRLYVMHAGWPMLDEMIGLLYAHPQVYVDVAVIDWVLPRAEFHAYLRRLVKAGFADRIMFGSDQLVWPEAFGRAVEAIESADFLTTEQRRGIFYNNAARFLRMDVGEAPRR